MLPVVRGRQGIDRTLVRTGFDGNGLARHLFKYIERLVRNFTRQGVFDLGIRNDRDGFFLIFAFCLRHEVLTRGDHHKTQTARLREHERDAFCKVITQLVHRNDVRCGRVRRLVAITSAYDPSSVCPRFIAIISRMLETTSLPRLAASWDDFSSVGIITTRMRRFSSTSIISTSEYWSLKICP